VIVLSGNEAHHDDNSNKGWFSKIKDALSFGKGINEDGQVSEKDTIEQVKSEQSLMSKIQDVLLFGKGTREDLKEFDMRLREDYFTELSDLRQRWEEIYLDILDSQQPSLNRKAKTVIQTLDRVKAQVNRATYGYAPLFNRTGQIGSNELARVFDYDKEFSAYLDRLKESEERIATSVASKDWNAVSAGVSSMKTLLDDTERRWREREKYFRSKQV
jgi:hypothetical protein